MNIRHPTSVSELHQLLNFYGYITDVPFAIELATVLNQPLGRMRGTFLTGATGTGKTYLVQVLATIMQAQLFYQQCTSGMQEEDLLTKPLPDENTISGVRLAKQTLFRLFEAIQADENACFILFFDEWEKTRAPADAFLLDFLQNGRINVNGVTYQLTSQQFERLVVFIAMNDDRLVSEFLLRRLACIEKRVMHSAQVRAALEHYHPENKHIDRMVWVYEQSLKAGLSKPATIQELSQLISAIESTEEQAKQAGLAEAGERLIDPIENPEVWHQLLSMWVLKTKGDIEKFKAIETDEKPYSFEKDPLTLLDPGAYKLWHPAADITTKWALPPAASAFMPGGSVEFNQAPMPEVIYGTLPLQQYANVATMIDQPGLEPCLLGDQFVVAGGQIIQTKALLLQDYAKFEALTCGRITLVEPAATLADMNFLKEKRGLKITYYTTTKVHGWALGLEIRWTVEAGAEIIVDLPCSNVLTKCGIISKYNDAWYGLNLLQSRFKNERMRILSRPAIMTDELRQVFDVDLSQWGDAIPDASVVICNDGQQKPEDGDGVMVRVGLYLPCQRGGTSELHDRLRFGNRCSIMGTALSPDWGAVDVAFPSHRGQSQKMIGVSWKSTAAAAVDYVYAELEKLVAMLRSRRQLKLE
jgi:MoxR-like ATPase